MEIQLYENTKSQWVAYCTRTKTSGHGLYLNTASFLKFASQHPRSTKTSTPLCAFLVSSLPYSWSKKGSHLEHVEQFYRKKTEFPMTILMSGRSNVPFFNVYTIIACQCMDTHTSIQKSDIITIWRGKTRAEGLESLEGITKFGMIAFGERRASDGWKGIVGLLGCWELKAYLRLGYRSAWLLSYVNASR